MQSAPIEAFANAHKTSSRGILPKREPVFAQSRQFQVIITSTKEHKLSYIFALEDNCFEYLYNK